MFKRNFLKFGLVFILLVGTVLPAFAEDNVLPDPSITTTPANVGIGDIATSEWTGLDFEVDGSDPVRAHRVIFYPYKVFPSQEFVDLKVPYVHVYDANGVESDQTRIQFMYIGSLGLYTLKEMDLNPGETATLTGEDVREFYAQELNSEPDGQIYFLVNGIYNGTINYKSSKMVYSDVVTMRTEITDNGNFGGTLRRNEWFQVTVITALESYGNYEEDSVTTYGYFYPQTSVAEVSYDETKNYKIGDEIELTLTATNQSSLGNSLNMLIQSDNLEFVGELSQEDVLWVNNENEFIARFAPIGENGKHIYTILGLDDSVTTTQRFKIVGNTETRSNHISINYGLSAYNNYDFSNTTELTIPLVGEDANYVVVDFDSNGGSTVDTQIIKKGTTLANVVDPTKDGFIFDGWYTTNDFTNLWDFENDLVFEDMTLFAKWTPNTPTVEKYTVTFDSNGGNDIPTQVIEKGGLVTLPNTPIKEGYTFQGWYTTNTFDTTWSFSKDIVSADITLYAKWEKKEVVPTNPDNNSRPGGTPTNENSNSGNNSTNVTLPKTGISNTNVYISAGLIFIGAFIIQWTQNRKKVK